MTSSRIPAAALVLAVASAASAQEQKAGGQKPSAAEQAMMEKYMKAATPGPEHQAMAKMAGKWNLKVTAWMMPGAPPQTSNATAEFKPTVGGRFMEQEVHGDMGGQPFEGHGLEGYDNVTHERWGTWVDNMTTGVMVMKGKCKADAKKCTETGKVSDAVAGKPVAVSSTMTMKDDNTMVFEMTGPGPDGKPFKNLEIVYTRAQ
jgi:hypothetical protein